MSKSLERKSKRNKRPTHTKATKITDEQGWTHVVRGPAAVRISKLESTDADEDIRDLISKKRAAEVLPAYTLGPPPLETLQELQNEYERQTKILSNSVKTTKGVLVALRREIEAGLAQNPAVSDIREAVCIGLGSPSTFRRVTSLRQLIAFEMALDVLAEQGRLHEERRQSDSEDEATSHAESESVKKYDQKDTKNVGKKLESDMSATSYMTKRNRYSIPVYFQELAFVPLDEVFLSSLGYTAVPVPTDIRREILNTNTTAATHIDLGPIEGYMSSSTFFFAPHLEIDMINLAATRRPPLLYFGTDMKALLDRQQNSSAAILQSSPESKQETDQRQNPTVSEDCRDAEASQVAEPQTPPKHWALHFDWRAPKECKGPMNDDAYWASDFAFGFNTGVVKS